jgi:hypothetical protein
MLNPPTLEKNVEETPVLDPNSYQMGGVGW